MAAPDGVDEALNGVEPPGARTIGALAVVRWAARDPGEPSEELDEGRPALTQGPYDEGDLDPEHTEADRVDFGAIRIPVPRGGQVSVEPEDGRLQAVHVMLPAGRLSVSALAAPRTARLWPDLAAEIDESLREGGATVRSFTGPWGRELHARTGEAASLFVGVDGPRWMLYGVATGPTGAAQELDAALRRMLRGVVVVRGRAPYPVRTVLPLTVPEHLAAAAEHPGAEPPAARNGRSARRPAALGRPGTGPAAAPQRPRGTPAPPPAAVPDPAGIPTEPHGLRRVASPGTNGYTNGRTPHANGSSVGRPLREADAGPAPRPLPDRRDAHPTTNGRLPAERLEQGVSATGQRRVADLLADAQRERAAQEAQREARERAAAREARKRAAAEAQREARERAVREARERAAVEARERAAQEARERAAQERAAAEARERAAQERAAAEARERLAQERAAQERAAQEARERAAQERAAADARERAAAEARERAAAEAREREAREARERAAAPPPSSSYRPAWSPAEPRPGLLAAPPLAAADPFGGRRPDDRRRDHRDDIAPLRLGGAPRAVAAGAEEYVPAWPASGRDGGTGLRPEPVARPADDGSEDWTLPIPVVRPEPARPSEGQHGRSGTDLWAGDPWAAEARRAARAARVAEGGSERPPPPDSRVRPEPDVERSGHHRPAHGRPGHHRPAHERGGDGRAVDVPAARVPPPVPPAWAHVRDEWADPFDDDPQSGRHRRPDR